MDVSQAAVAIREVIDFEFGDVHPILGGWAYWTFEVDGEWIFRFPRDDQIARAAESELRLLPALATHVDFEVPIPRWSGTWGGRPFFGYRKLQGRPLRASDVEREPAALRRLADMLRQIHSFDVDTARRLLRVEGSVLGWQRGYQELRTAAASPVADLLDPHTGSLLDRGFSGLLDRSLEFTPTLVHRDLGNGHILVDQATAHPVGIIDFEDADVGDPAIDFVGFWITLGPERTQRLLDIYQGDLDATFIERIKTYWWMGALHAVLYGIAQEDQSIIDEGVAGLRRRLGTLNS